MRWNRGSNPGVGYDAYLYLDRNLYHYLSLDGWSDEMDIQQCL